VGALALSPDGKTLAARRWCGVDVALWDVGTGRKKRDLARPDDTGAIYPSGYSRGCIFFSQSLALSPDGRRLASATDGGTAALCRVEGTLLWPAQGALFSPPSLAFAPDGKTLAWPLDGTVRLADADTGKPLRALRGVGDGVASLIFSPDSRTLAVVDRRGVHL